MPEPAPSLPPGEDEHPVPTVAGDLAVPVEPVSPDTPCHHVYQRMYLDRRLQAIPVVDGSGPLGVISRTRFFPLFEARDCRDVHGTHTIVEHLPSSSLIVDADLPLVDLADRLTEDSGGHLGDGFIVTKGGAYVGVGAPAHLLRALADGRLRDRHLRTYRDALTGLPNRQLFEDRLSVALVATERVRRKLAVVWLDLDDFGAVNDVHGRAAGDAVLAEVAARLRAGVRRGDTVARVGSDEFAVLLPSIASIDAARGVAAKLVGVLAGPVRLGEASLPIECNAGLAVCPDDGTSVWRLMRAAEQAANHARDVRRYQEEGDEAGRGPSARVDDPLVTVVEAGPVAAAVCSYSALRRALERRELTLFYQPQVDVATGRMCGVEALVRWPSAVRPVSASEIIALADTSGLVLPFTEWVVAAACQQLREWHEAGLLVLRMAINVSSAQVRQPALAGLVERVLEDAGLPPASVELEINAPLVMTADSAIERALATLRGVGVRLAIDRVGPTPLSLECLARLPVDSVKLDHSVVARLGEGDEPVRVAGALIALAHALGLEAIASGVETEPQWRLLRARHCDVMQGHYFCRPVAPAEIARLIRAGHVETPL